MHLLQTNGGSIVDSTGQPVRLRGTCAGGWMNMENFINGYPGAEHTLRTAIARELGENRAEFLFERWLDHFFNEEDVKAIKAEGATVVRLPVNYRHFEDDRRPGEWKENGFRRLEQAIGWCRRHGVYAIIDLHAVQGWQNPDWHSDNANRVALFWSNPHYQDRFVALWQEIARRFVGNPAVAGYNLINEPVTNAPFGRMGQPYVPDWETMNAVYRRTCEAIRTVDPDHILFLEGDFYAGLFIGLEAPFAPNLVYSSHNYNAAGFGPGPYPGLIKGAEWDRAKQQQVLEATEGFQFTRKHNVPLWVGEFGSVFNGPAEEIADRTRAMLDQIAVFNENDVHWTTWTYKDVGIMSWFALAPDCEFLEVTASVMKAKMELASDWWQDWLPNTPARDKVREMARLIEQTAGEGQIEPRANENFLTQVVLDNYVGALLQPLFARCFAGMSENRLDELFSSFRLANCRPLEPLLAAVRPNLTAEPRANEARSQ